MPIIAGQHGFPEKYGGVSGGGAWVIPLTMDPDKGESTLRYEPLYCGAVFYEFFPDAAGQSKLIAHGPESIYKRLPEKLNEA